MYTKSSSISTPSWNHSLTVGELYCACGRRNTRRHRYEHVFKTKYWGTEKKQNSTIEQNHNNNHADNSLRESVCARACVCECKNCRSSAEVHRIQREMTSVGLLPQGCGAWWGHVSEQARWWGTVPAAPVPTRRGLCMLAAAAAALTGGNVRSPIKNQPN